MNPAERTKQILDAVLCGYPNHVREVRMFAALSPYSAYIDDSGNDQNSAHFVLSSLVAPVDSWRAFSDNWYKELMSRTPKPLNKGKKGKIYYKARDADGLRNCFQGFTRDEADEKTDRLTDVLREHIVSGYAFSCSVPHIGFRRVMAHRGLRDRKGNLYRWFADPYYLLFQTIIQGIGFIQAYRLIEQWQKVDFFFDAHGKIGQRCLDMYADAIWKLEQQGSRLAELMGIAIPADDTETLPLQASDLWASWVRKRLQNTQGRSRESFRNLIRSRMMIHSPLTAASLDAYMTEFNAEFSSRFLARVAQKQDRGELNA